jgi:RNA polymerase sigma factor (sigma-70 family)
MPMPSRPVRTLLGFLQQIALGRSALGEGDTALLERFAATRDEAAFATLVCRHGPMVLGVCRQLLPTEQDAEDVFQATFLVLARKARSIRRQEALAGWLHRVAQNLARTARARAAARRCLPMSSEPADLPAPATENEWREWRPILHEEVARLPAKYRAPVVLCYLEGKTSEQAAQELGWPSSSVRVQLCRARDMLRGRLERRGLALSVEALAVGLCCREAAAALPPQLLAATVRDAGAFAAGELLTGTAASLATGMLRGLALSRLKLALALVLPATLVLGVAVAARPMTVSRTPPTGVALPIVDAGVSMRIDPTTTLRPLRAVPTGESRFGTSFHLYYQDKLLVMPDGRPAQIILSPQSGGKTVPVVIESVEMVNGTFVIATDRSKTSLRPF